MFCLQELYSKQSQLEHLIVVMPLRLVIFLIALFSAIGSIS